MKIVFVNRYFFPDHSATSQMLTDLAFHLASCGWRVEVVCSRQRYDDPGARLGKREDIQGVEVRRIATTRFGRTWLPGRLLDFASFYMSAFLRLLVDVKRGDILVAKTDPPMISVICAFVARLKGARQINWIQDLFPEVAVALGISGLHGWAYSTLKGIRNWSLEQAAANVVLGERMKAWVVRETGNPESLHIIHNWADGDGIVPVSAESNRLRHEWGLDGKFVIGYSGNMGRAHQFETILDLAERLRESPDIVFLFIGGGAKRDWIESDARRRSLANVQFREYQPRECLAESLCVPDVHLISLNPDLEGLIVPSKFYGIAAAGRPMLFIGDVDGELARMIRKGDCGASVATGDVTSGIACILALQASQSERERQGNNARAMFSECYGMEMGVTAWQSLLAGITAPPDSGMARRDG